MAKELIATGQRLACLMLLCLSYNAHAHNVISGVYAIGSTIEGEIGFSNGDMAPEGTEVIVSDAQGNELGRVKTDEEGLFSYQATERMDYAFYANLSSGHVAEMLLPADQLPASLGGGSEAKRQSQSVSSSQGVTVNSTDHAQLSEMIEAAVAKQVKPLRQELAAYQAKAGLQDIIGGIGYIFGLCGLGIWWRHRQQKSNANKPKTTQQDTDNASVS